MTLVEHGAVARVRQQCREREAVNFRTCARVNAVNANGKYKDQNFHFLVIFFSSSQPNCSKVMKALKSNHR
jgi:hypothetical protein